MWIIPYSLYMQGLQAEAVMQKEALYKEVSSIRVELQQVRGDRDSQRQQLQKMTAEIEKYKLYTDKSSMELDKITLESKNLEVRCYRRLSVVYLLISQAWIFYVEMVSYAGKVSFPKQSNKDSTGTAICSGEEITSILYFSGFFPSKWHHYTDII